MHAKDKIGRHGTIDVVGLHELFIQSFHLWRYVN